MQRVAIVPFFAAIAVSCLLAGCTHRSAPATPPPPTVTVSRPIEKSVTDFADFTGRTDAVFSTDIRPRVTGYLTKMPFKEGAHVAKDDVLFEIDERPYKAALDAAKAAEASAKASLTRAQAVYEMDLNLKKASAGAVSAEDLIKHLGDYEMAKADLQRANASVDSAQLNYNWCKVRSPIDGQVSRYLLTTGNLVNADVTELTTVVSTEPMYVYFDIDENTMLSVLRKIMLPAKEDPLAKPDAIPVLMGLADEAEFPHRGYMNFANNAVNASTGTITVRSVFDNHASPAGKRLLRPGMFVRVRLPMGKPHEALLVHERALGSDQGQKYLLLVDDKGVVLYRPVETGPLQEDGLRVISKGLNPGDRVIVDGLQSVRPEMTVKAEEVPNQGLTAEKAASDQKTKGGEENK